MNLKQILGKNIKYYRFKNHYTQEKLATLINSSPKYISRLELGQHNPSIEMIKKISKALGIGPDKLFINNKEEHLPEKVNMLSKKGKIIKSLSFFQIKREQSALAPLM